MQQKVIQGYEAVFGQKPDLLSFAPGRVNLIGEHTDYNRGFVLPIAIDRGTYIAAKVRNDEQVCVYALDFDCQSDSCSLNERIAPSPFGWGNYVRGTLVELRNAYPQIGGLDMVISGDVPQGAGLSSSASLEIALLAVFRDAYHLPLTGVEAAKLAQRAENKFVGCACGIMDQLISAQGKSGHAMLLDCADLSVSHTKIPEDYAVLVINSHVKRGLVDSEYNLRRKQCEQAAQCMGVDSLRSANLTDLHASRESLPPLAYQRAHHVITENQRVLDMFNALQTGSLDSISRLMASSHRSMKEDFEVTVEPIDTLVEIVKSVIGSRGGVRMTGGGFGGCVVVVTTPELVAQVEQKVTQVYPKMTGLQPSFYQCSAQQGAFSEPK
ncbi:galactokinase [Alteromonas sp. SM 2104]|nr:galactokinase [Alteromonas oceanisediminis]